MTVLHYQIACSGYAGQVACLVVEDEDGEASVLYEPIEGLGFEWGHTKRIRVSVEDTRDPSCPDCFDTRYVLREVLSDEEVAVDTTFTVWMDPVAGRLGAGAFLTFDEADGTGELFDGTPLTCADETCDELAAAIAGESPFSAELGYGGEAYTPLVVVAVLPDA